MNLLTLIRNIPEFIKDMWEVTKESLFSWYNRDPFRNSTVISYYTLFSLPGLVVIIINLAGYFYGTEAITQRVSADIEDAIGAAAATSIEDIIARAYTGEGMTLSSIISIGTLLFGATGVFYQIQQTLNIIWEVEPKPEQMLLKFLRDRLFSFGMILAIGFLLLVSLVLSSLITLLSNWLGEIFGIFALILALAEFLFSLGVITLLFAGIFKVLPDVKIRWKDVWPGAIITALLFVIARYALGLYFSLSDPGSVYGAAGSVILILLWTTYSGMILLYGAEFTRVFAIKYGIRIEPSEVAVSTKHSKEKKGADFTSRVSKKGKEEQAG